MNGVSNEEKIKELIQRYKKAELWFEQDRTSEEVERALVTLQKILNEIKVMTALLRKEGKTVDFKEFLK